MPPQVAFIFILAGVGLITFCAFKFTSSQKLIKGGAHAIGTVTQATWRMTRSGPIHNLVVSFETDIGENIKFKAEVGGRVVEVGYLFPVIYDPTNPQNAKIYLPEPFWGDLSVQIVIAVGLVILGIAGFVYSL
ncbi:MAG: DUF3592 domain-containing protein [Anaerolineales bacterium]|nr:DUF3592 domain-containing protein [Anaerolineales bacterium]